jgi:glycosyltransferase involved in cell wall biosynthesis
VITTRNTGGEDLIVENTTGFLVPIRSPEAIAEKLTWFLSNRPRIPDMGAAAQARARELTWRGYGDAVVGAVCTLMKIDIPLRGIHVVAR